MKEWLVSVVVISRAKELQFTPAPALIDAFVDDGLDGWTIDGAVRTGLVRLVRRWLQRQTQKVTVRDMTNVLRDAASMGDMRMVKALFTYRPEDAAFPDDQGGAGVANVMAWLAANGKQHFVNRFFQFVLYSGNLELAQWVYAHWRGASYDVDIDRLVARIRSVEILQWLHTLPSPPCTLTATTDAMEEAALSNAVEIVEWLHVNRTEGCTAGAMHSAACYGHIDVVKFLHANRLEGCKPRTMDAAALNGHLEVIQFLHANRPEGCTKRAMDLAASRGHLAVVQFLHENRSEGCTTDAMDSAARNGHLDVLQYLHENRTEGCTHDGMAAALRNSHHRVTEYMSKTRIRGLQGRCKHQQS